MKSEKFSNARIAIRRPSVQIATGSIVVALSSLSVAVYAQLQLTLVVVIPLLVLVIGLLLVVVNELREVKSGAQALSERPALTSASVGETAPFSFEVYLQYTKLHSEQLGVLFLVTSKLFGLLYGVKKGWEVDSEVLLGRGLDSRLRTVPDGALLLDYVVTGESIKWRAKTGWKPTISNSGDHTYIDVPTGPFVAFYIGIMLGVGAKFGVSTAKDIIDIRLNLQQEQKVALEIEQLEHSRELWQKQERKLELEIEDLEKRLSRASPDIQDQVSETISVFLNLTMSNSFVANFDIRSMAYGRDVSIGEMPEEGVGVDDE